MADPATIAQDLTNAEPLKQIYSCGCEPIEQKSRFSILVPFVVIALLILTFKSNAGFSKFVGDKSVIKILTTLYLATNAKNLNQSLIDNLVLPVIKPLMPWISNHNQNIEFGPFKLKIGNFLTDLVVFTLNVFFVYFMFAWMSN